jgi:hypothetical protein
LSEKPTVVILNTYIDVARVLAVQDLLRVVNDSELIVGHNGKDVQKILPVSVSDTILDIKLGRVIIVLADS